MPNDMYRNRYYVQESLRRGLYGDIWLCKDSLQDDAPVAVKEVALRHAKRALALNPHMDNPFQERRVVNKLMWLPRNENIVAYQQEFLEHGSWFLCMEYCAGGDLLDVVQAAPETHLAESIALRLFRQVVRGVHFLHDNGLAHRDLSLENVLISNGVCKISDFGLAVEGSKRRKDRVGKAYYMAPEVVAQEEYHPQPADMWSLGIMLFIMLTGSPLVPCAAADEKAFLAVKSFGVETILKVWGLRDSLSTDAMNLLSGLLQVDPAKRLTIYDVFAHPALVNLP